jgi:hypothetical protein
MIIITTVSTIFGVFKFKSNFPFVHNTESKHYLKKSAVLKISLYRVCFAFEIFRIAFSINQTLCQVNLSISKIV